MKLSFLSRDPVNAKVPCEKHWQAEEASLEGKDQMRVLGLRVDELGASKNQRYLFGATYKTGHVVHANYHSKEELDNLHRNTPNTATASFSCGLGFKTQFPHEFGEGPDWNSRHR